VTSLQAFPRKIARIARTVRHLTARQIAWRIVSPPRLALYRAMPPVAWLMASGDGRMAPSARDLLDPWIALRHGDGITDAQRALADRVMAGDFGFVGESLKLGRAPLEWRPAGRSRLWLYHLHYFDYLRALCLLSRAMGDPAPARLGWQMAADWLAQNRPGSRPGWEPYPTALRIINWVAAWTIAPPEAPTIARGFARTLAAQTRFLARHLEFNVGGNHLVKDAAALVIAGTALGGREAEGWRARGLALLRAELRTQILADGGHDERSPLYHAVILEDVLDCAALTGADDLRRIAGRMGEWLAAMRHPDGALALFNDAVAFPDTSPAELLRYGGRLADPQSARERGELVRLEPSGYTILHSGDSRMIIDCGAIGPDEFPAHAHADTLAFELAVGMERAIVNSGTSTYRAGPVRDHERSTAAHNTVEIDRTDQSEVWASHRVGRRARPLGCRAWSADGFIGFAGAHDGYARLGVVHQRHVLGIPPAWLIVDELLGHGHHEYVSRVHVHPAWTVTLESTGARLVGPTGRALRLRSIAPADVQVERGTHADAFGNVRPNSIVRLARSGDAPVLLAYALIPDAIELDVRVDVDAEGIAVQGLVEYRSFSLRSTRTCTFSS